MNKVNYFKLNVCIFQSIRFPVMNASKIKAPNLEILHELTFLGMSFKMSLQIQNVHFHLHKVGKCNYSSSLSRL
jgi:hypothetical protein